MLLTFSGNVLGHPGIITGPATHPLEGPHVLDGIILGSGQWHHSTEQGFNFCLDVTMNGYRISVASIHGHLHLLYLFLLLKRLRIHLLFHRLHRL